MIGDDRHIAGAKGLETTSILPGRVSRISKTFTVPFIGVNFNPFIICSGLLESYTSKRLSVGSMKIGLVKVAFGYSDVCLG